MHYIGIDLAWGLNRPTGLAVLDDAARLVHISAVRTDDEIVESLTPYVGGRCLVGIDAPLIVVNATGSRPAEQALSKDFRRFEAGTHPSNTGKPEFADGTRGARICERLGLDLDPDSTAERRALEVYPHPATIVLFDLDRTLKYKQKQGRDLELLRRELLRLMDHTARLVDTGGPDSQWAEMRAAVAAAPRKSDLRVVEDQVDAVVCAYVALFARRWPERTTTTATSRPATSSRPPSSPGAGTSSRPPLPSTTRATRSWSRRAGTPSRSSRASSTTPASTTSASTAGPRASPRSPRRPAAAGRACCSIPTRCATSATSSASA